MPEISAIFTDSYSRKCKTFSGQADRSWTPANLLPPEYDLSWVNQSVFWRRLHHEVNRLQNKSTILTNNPFLYECLSASILNSDFPKEFTAVATEQNEESVLKKLEELEKFLKRMAYVTK